MDAPTVTRGTVTKLWARDDGTTELEVQLPTREIVNVLGVGSTPMGYGFSLLFVDVMHQPKEGGGDD